MNPSPLPQTRPVIGWEQETPVPDHVFNDYLQSRAGRLYLEDLDLTQLFRGDGADQGLGGVLPSPLEIIYLPLIRRNIARLQGVFAAAIRETGYAGRFLYAYTSKANAAEEVVRTALQTGVHYEISSALDVDIVRLMKAGGHLTPEQRVICNGFKPAGLTYADNILALRREHEAVLPVIEDPHELQPLVESGLTFDVGLRQKSYGAHQTSAEMETANSRFGMTRADLFQTAARIAATPNLRLRLYHAMVGSQLVNQEDFVARLTPPIEVYAELRQHYPDLTIFDFGGGIPAPMTLDFNFDYRAFAVCLLTALQTVCGRYGVPVPDVLGEVGRYTVAEHGAHLFKVVLVKENQSRYPWYLINGSIMTSFPDSWALGEHFVVLPLNHLDQPFRRVQLGGLTCDSDDIYPPRGSEAPLYLPVETRELYLGFFSIGAYQEMLGGVGGTKHCIIPEANELIVDRDPAGKYQFQRLPGQNLSQILSNLGYRDRQ